MEIKPQKILSASVTMEDDFVLGNGIESCEIGIKLIRPPKFPNELYVFITYQYIINSLKTNKAFRSKIIKPFGVSPYNEICDVDIYECITKTKEQVQLIVNSLFINFQTTPEVKVSSFEELKEDLNNSLASL
ncbi:MAG TPA: hypothetical protein VFM99_07645 [Chitinophagales bacterium]|nr:hypothetical protein [Chitinophagales bacterium]